MAGEVGQDPYGQWPMSSMHILNQFTVEQSESA